MVEMWVDSELIPGLIVPEVFILNPDPGRIPAFPDIIRVLAAERGKLEVFAIDNEVALLTGEEGGGFGVEDVEFVIGGQVDGGDLGGCAFEVVRVGQEGTLLRGGVPALARPKVPNKAP